MRNPTLLARIAAVATGTALAALLVLAAPADAPTPEVGLIPPICATTDPVAFPCPDGVPVLLP